MPESLLSLLPDLELLLEEEEPVADPDFLELVLPEDFPSVDEPDLDLEVVDLEPEDEAFVLLLFPDDVEATGILLLELPMLEVLPMPDEPVFFLFVESELLPDDESDELPDMLPEVWFFSLSFIVMISLVYSL